MNSPETLTSVLDKEPQPRDVTDEVLMDFYLSFKFSQGGALLQHVLMDELVSYYGSNLAPEDRSAIADFAKLDLVTRAVNLKIPAKHYHTPLIKEEGTKEEGELEIENEVKRTFYTEAEIFARAIRRGLSYDEKMAPDNSKHLLEIANLMISRDERFMTEEARNVADENYSFFRDYVVLGNPTHSEAFDAIFRSVNGNLAKHGIDTEYQQRLDNVVTQWEATHPGESFYPEAA